MAKKKEQEPVTDEQSTEQEPAPAKQKAVVEEKQAPAPVKSRFILEKDYSGYIGRNVQMKAGEEARGSILRQLQKENHPLKELKA